jgi:hypothetical protein
VSAREPVYTPRALIIHPEAVRDADAVSGSHWDGSRAGKQFSGLGILPRAAGRETKESVLERFAVQAIAGGAKTLRIEYDEGYEEVYACQGGVGVSIGCRIPSSSEEAKSLRAELYAMRKRPRRIDLDGRTYELRCRTYDSFGEDAFEVPFRPV